MRYRRSLTRATRQAIAAAAEVALYDPQAPLALLFGGWSEKQIKLQLSFAAYDSLPSSLRRALYESTVTFEPEPVMDWWQQHRRADSCRPVEVARLGVRLIRAGEHQDLLRFAAAYRQRYRVRLPHVAAKASILRYRRRQHDHHHRD